MNIYSDCMRKIGLAGGTGAHIVKAERLRRDQNIVLIAARNWIGQKRASKRGSREIMNGIEIILLVLTLYCAYMFIQIVRL